MPDCDPGSSSFGPATPASLRFADCELRVEKRELLVGGAIQRMQPRVFDLLLYLVERRDRVVTRNELLRHVWRTEHVSDSVIGRCIMKARRVIGDVDPQAPFIRTLPRAGYRFVREVVSSRPVSAALPETAPCTRVLTIAALPFQNGTQREELVWVEFGLAALLNMELKARRGLSVMPLVDVLTELRGCGAASMRAVERLHAGGVRFVVAVQVHACEDGFELCYHLHGGEGVADAGRMRGSDPTQLTIALGRKLAHELDGRDDAHETGLATADTFTSEAFLRARRAANEQRYQMAQNYLQVCVASEPYPLVMEVEHLESLAAIEHPETPSRAQCLLARTAADADVVSQARVLRSLATYHRAMGDVALARTLVQQALALLDPHGEIPLRSTLLLEDAELAIAGHDFGRARELCRHVLATTADGTDRDHLIAHGLRLEGVLAHLHGEPAHALEALQRSAQLSRAPHVRHADLASTLQGIAAIHRNAGRLTRAITAIDEAVNCAQLAGSPVQHALALVFQLMLHRQAGHLSVAEAARRALQLPALQQSRGGRFLSQLAEAWLHGREGRHAEALEQMEQIRHLASEMREFRLGLAMPVHACIAITAGRPPSARELIAEMEVHRSFYDATGQRGLAAFFRAALAYVEDDRGLAWHRLREAIAVSSPGIVRAGASLAAAWLACESHDLDEVQGWLEQAGAWAMEHPSGITTLARYRFELGDWAGAVAHQARYVERWPADDVSPYQRHLLRSYREALRSGRIVDIPRSPQLPNLHL